MSGNYSKITPRPGPEKSVRYSGKFGRNSVSLAKLFGNCKIYGNYCAPKKDAEAINNGLECSG